METTKVKSLKRVNYIGKVYDLTVPGFHTYNIEGKVVHNSGGGSLVIYALSMSTIDPIKYGLIFSRFLSQDRCADLVLNYFGE